MVLKKAGDVGFGCLRWSDTQFTKIDWLTDKTRHEDEQRKGDVAVMRLPLDWVEARELFEEAYPFELEWRRVPTGMWPVLDAGSREDVAWLDGHWSVFTKLCCRHLSAVQP